MLARDAEPPAALARLRGLRLGVGEEVAGRLRGTGPGVPTEIDAGPLADVLGLLADHGWRPSARSGATLCGLWEHLAGLVGDKAERRRLPISALQVAAGGDETRRVRDTLAGLEEPETRSRSDARASTDGLPGV